MTRSDGLNQLLEDELTRAAAQIQGDDGLTRTLVEGSVTRLRRHQRRRVVAAAATTSLAVLATGLVGWQLQSDSGNAEPAMHLPDSVSIPAVAPTYHFRRSFSPLGTAATWAQALPRGEDTTEPFVAGNRLYEGGRVVELGQQTEATLEASLPGGWLAQYSDRVDSQGNQIHRRMGFLDVDGQFRAFPFRHGTESSHQTRGVAASPDGSRVAYGGSIIDVATGLQVRLLPQRLSHVDAWTRMGIAYVDSSGDPMLWTPGSASRATTWRFESAVTATQRVGSCTRIGHLGDDGIIHPLAIVCGDGPGGAASDNGLFFTNSGKVVDLATGKIILHIPVTGPVDGIFPGQCCGKLWTDDGHLLVTVETLNGIPFADYVLVSCAWSHGDLTCTRATDRLNAYPVPVGALTG